MTSPLHNGNRHRRRRSRARTTRIDRPLDELNARDSQ